MKACAIICEYNPFHTGHAYHIEETKKHLDADIYIGIMCNHFVQRGNIACASAKERCLAAINNGLDLIVELPYPFSVQAADKYSEGAIKIADMLKVDYLSFGSESGDINTLKKLSNIIIPIDKTTSLASANHSSNSNDILAISYLKQLNSTSIEPFTIKRTSSYHDDTLNEFASASALRKAALEKQDISKYTSLEKHMINNTIKDYYPYLRSLLLTLPKDYLKEIFLIEEGIENLLIKNAESYSNFEEFLNNSTSKKYTTSRIQRTLIHLLLQTSKENAISLEENIPLRLLASNTKGLQYIKDNKIEVISKFNQLPKDYQTYLMKAEGLIHSRNEDDMNIELQYPIIIKD